MSAEGPIQDWKVWYDQWLKTEVALKDAERRAEVIATDLERLQVESEATIGELTDEVAECQRRAEEAEAALAEERQDRGTGFTRRHARIVELEALVGRYSQALIRHATEDWGPYTARLGHVTSVAREVLSPTAPSTTEEP